MSTPIDLTQLPAPSVVEVLDFQPFWPHAKPTW